MSVIKTDPDSLELGQKMKQEIEERLKENGKPSVLEIEHQTNDNFQFVFGKCIDPASINHSCVIVCFFKAHNNWFVDQIYVEYGDGVSPRISGPYTYEQARECFYKFAYADIDDLVNTHITEADDFKLKQVRYSNLKALNNYLSLDKATQTLIENYIPKLYSFIKANIDQYDDFNILDDKIEFTFHDDMYDVTWYLDYHQKPYKYGWYRSPIDKDGWIQYSREKSPVITYNSLKTIQRCFALQVKNEISDPFFDKLDNQSHEAQLYEQLKLLQNAQEYEKVFSDPISFDWFCKFYGFDDKTTNPMTKEKFACLFKDGLPDGFVLGMPSNTGDTGIYQSKDNKWIIGHVGDSSSSYGADRYSFSVLYVSNNEEKAFNLFYEFVTGKEDPNKWIINGKYEDDERIEEENKISAKDKVEVAFEKGEIKDLLLGKLGYYVPFDKYLGPAGPTDWTILMPSVYKYAKAHKDAQDKFEQTLFDLIRDNKDRIWTNSFEVYVVIGIFYYQIFHEKRKQAGFDLKHKNDLIDSMHDILLKKYTQLSDSIFWSEIVRYCNLLNKECQIDLFAKSNKKLDKDFKQYVVKLNQFIKPLSAGLRDNVIHCHIDNEIEYTLDLCNKSYTYTEFERGSVRYTKHFNDFGLAKRWYALTLRSSKSDDFLDELQAHGDDFKVKLHNYYMALDDLKTYEDIFGEKFAFDDLISYCGFNPDDIEKFEVTAVTRLDPDSDELGKRMKHEIEQVLKEKNKPNLDKLALQKSGRSLLQYQFGKYRDPALVQPDDSAICVFKTDNAWFVEEVFSIYGDGTYTPISGPFTYEQAKTYFLDYMLHDYPKLATAWYELDYRRFDDFNELDKYLALNKSVRQSINDYLSDLYKIVKPNLDELADFKVGATGMYFEMPKVINQQKYQITYTFDYHKKPYTISYEQFKIESDGFIYGKPVKQSSTKYTDLSQAEQAFKEKLINSLKDDKK